jgi:hypothetical protein
MNDSDERNPWVKYKPKGGWSPLAVDRIVARGKLPPEDLRVFLDFQRKSHAPMGADSSPHREEMCRRYGHLLDLPTWRMARA